MPVWFEDSAAVTVVMASEGYPGTYPKGLEITGKYSRRNCRSLDSSPALSQFSLLPEKGESVYLRFIETVDLVVKGQEETEFSHIKVYW